MAVNDFEIHYYQNGMPCFCHSGYINGHDTPPLPNWHRDLEILVCTGGTGYITYDEKVLDFQKGDIVIVNSGVSHHVLTHSRVDYYYILINPDFQTESGIPVTDFYFTEHIKDEHLYALAMDMVDICQSRQDYKMLRIRLACLALLLHLATHYTRRHTVSKDAICENRHVKKALDYIKYHYADYLTVADIAKHVGIGQTKLAKEFRTYTNHSVSEQINIYRCIQAKTLILQQVKIADAAASCGFDNQSYFTKIYKKYIGERPSDTQNHLLSVSGESQEHATVKKKAP